MKTDGWSVVELSILLLAVVSVSALLFVVGECRADNRLLNQVVADYGLEVDARMQDLEYVASQRDEALAQIAQLAADRDLLEQELTAARMDLERMGEELEFIHTPVVVHPLSEEEFLRAISCWPVTSDPCLDEHTQEEFNHALLWCLDVQAQPVSSCVRLILEGE